MLCTEPPPPTGILARCDVIAWETPDYYCDGILTGYQIQFYDPAATTTTVLVQDVPENRTFYAVQENDRLGGPLNTAIRVHNNNIILDGLYNYNMGI